MNVLLVWPRYPDTYWSFNYALKFISKTASNVPLGLITVAALLPQEWNKKLIDLNDSALRDKDIQWADYVFISAMSVQSASVAMIIKQCKLLNAKIVAGGPLFTEEYDRYPEIDHLVLNEAEVTLPEFIEDVFKGTPRKKYDTNGFADLTTSPVPDYSLLHLKSYATAGIQYSRGCPFDCEFCDITALFGRHVRTKSTQQIISELDQLYKLKWKGSVFFVDDNFIGHKKKLKSELLPAIIEWMQVHGNPFEFLTEASINLEDDKELMELMVKAGFTKVFVGIETPEESCLTECNKLHNRNRDLINSIKKIQKFGMEVYGGFIVGFDNDPSGIFQRQIDFIQESGIITAMVGLLNAPRLSRLYKRLDGEGRISYQFSGDNTNGATNIIPVMNKDELIKGYNKIIRNIYSAKPYAERVIRFLKYYNPPSIRFRLSPAKIMALFKSFLYLGLLNRDLIYFWKIFFWSLLFRPRLFGLAVEYSVYGYHFKKVFRDIVY
ncbi:MAG TPA: B12-binding domain-containing radical SAM protein [Bacteroidales bacterium]|nr:B12-binding domain-containing radical SAM protein [Bacteroidales bacterium]